MSDASASNAVPTAALEREPATIQLPPHCTIGEADALREILLERVAEPDLTILDADAVARVDTAGLQLLLAFVRDRAARDQAVAWRAVPENLLLAAGRLGLESQLCLTSTVD